MQRILAVLSLTIFAGLAAAQTLEEKARELEGKLIAPCCWSQPVSQHYSAAADDIRAEVRRQLAEGKTPEQVLDSYVSQYGERILASPRPQGFNLLAYVLPYVSLGLGIVVVATILKKWRARAPRVEPAGASAAASDPRYAARLEQELRELE
ncbi:MAG: hypothetical protein FJW35_00885 [Acidobacteria bacterium]|nr:hypothetical protein [Acidobacteriota bacterium]